MNCNNLCCDNNGYDHHNSCDGGRYGINVNTLAHTGEPLLICQAAELVPEDMRKPGTKITFWTYDGWQTWQFLSKDVREWVLPEHWNQEANFGADDIRDLQNQIDSIQLGGGLAFSNEFGSDPHIGISQKKLTETFEHTPTLDSNGKVPPYQLPSYVDDVVEGYLMNDTFFADSAHTELIEAETGKIYVDIPTRVSYRYSGSGYIAISNPYMPDEEDLTVTNDLLKFKDKAHDAENFSGLGKKILRKNLVGGVNKLTQAMVNAANTEYIVQYDFDLDGQDISMPAGCSMKFEGGSISNGTITGNDTVIDYTQKESIDNVTLAGTYSYSNALKPLSNIDSLIESGNMLDNPFFKTSDDWTLTDCTVDGKLNINGVGYASQTKQFTAGHRYLVACYARVTAVHHSSKGDSNSYKGRYGLGFRVKDATPVNGSYKLNVDFVANRDVDDFIPIIYVVDITENCNPTLFFGEIYDGNGTLEGVIRHAGLYDITDYIKGIPNYKRLFFAYKKYVERELQYTSSYIDMKYADTMGEYAFREEENKKAKFLYMNNACFETASGSGSALDKYNDTVTYVTTIEPTVVQDASFIVANTGGISSSGSGSKVYVYSNINPKNKYFFSNIHTSGLNIAYCYFYGNVPVYPRSGIPELSANWLSLTSGGDAITPDSGKVYELVAASSNYGVGDIFKWDSTNGIYKKYSISSSKAYTYTDYMDKPNYYEEYGVRKQVNVDIDDKVYLSIPSTTMIIKLASSTNPATGTHAVPELTCLSEAPINESSVRLDSTDDSTLFRYNQAYVSAKDLCILNGVAATDRKVQEIWNTQGTDLVMYDTGDTSEEYGTVQMARTDTWFNDKYFTIYGKGGAVSPATAYALCVKERLTGRWFAVCLYRRNSLPNYRRVTALPDDPDLAAALLAAEPDVYAAIAALEPGQYYTVTAEELATYYPYENTRRWLNENTPRMYDQLIGWYKEDEDYDTYGLNQDNRYTFNPDTEVDWDSCAVCEIYPDMPYVYNEIEGYIREADDPTHKWETSLQKKFSVVKGKKVDMAFKPMSTAKTMTVLTAMQYMNLSDYVEYKEGNRMSGSGWSYKYGEYYSLRECIVFLLAASDNSIASNIANQVGPRILEARYGK